MNRSIKTALIVFGNVFLICLLLVSIAIYTKFEGTFNYYLLALIGTIITLYFLAYTILRQIESISKN